MKSLIRFELIDFLKLIFERLSREQINSERIFEETEEKEFFFFLKELKDC